jgi:hypothetical protein
VRDTPNSAGNQRSLRSLSTTSSGSTSCKGARRWRGAGSATPRGFGGCSGVSAHAGQSAGAGLVPECALGAGSLPVCIRYRRPDRGRRKRIHAGRTPQSSRSIRRGSACLPHPNLATLGHICART